MNSKKDSKALSKERYGKFAAGYVNSRTHAKGADLDRMVALTNPQKDWNVLDIATGGGHTALKFAPHVKTVVASDLTAPMLAVAEEFITGKGITNVSFRQADAEDLPFADEEFDLVTCRIAAHHFPNCAKFVAEAVRVLKPSGTLIVEDHILPEDEITTERITQFDKLRDPSHFRAYSNLEWRSMFTAAGLSVKHTEELSKRHVFISWTKRQGNSQNTIKRLIELVAAAPPPFTEWVAPQDWGTENASFRIQYLMILGCKQ